MANNVTCHINVVPADSALGEAEICGNVGLEVSDGIGCLWGVSMVLYVGDGVIDSWCVIGRLCGDIPFNTVFVLFYCVFSLVFFFLSR